MSDAVERLSAALADHYRIERELGAGGMATVYLAGDLKHDRKVALKVLRPELTAILGGERFLNEIRLTANLQHPHILPLFDSGEAGGLLFYVMPYVEGESLRQKLERERELSIEDAVQVTIQVAHALDYAHRHEVVHRDIKPANILLHDGQALVADFGIALAVRAAGGDRLTETGLSLGTPQYMSPEQATADRVLDARSDIYSLGCVAYEMLAGEPPHSGPSTQAIIAKIVTEEPRPLPKCRRNVPHHVQAAVHKALEKLPADRFHSAAEFAEAVSKPGHVSAATAVAPPTAEPTLRRSVDRYLWPAAAILATGAAIWGWSRSDSSTAPDIVARFVVTLPSSEQVAEAPGEMMSVAPDGSGFVYVGVSPDGRMLYFRSFNRFESRPLPGTEDAAWPFFSPDGQWIGFQAEGRMKKVALSGGPPQTITGGTFNGGSWGPDDTIVFHPSGSGGLMMISADGGEARPLTVADSATGERHAWPWFTPDGNSVFFLGSSNGGGFGQIGVASYRTGAVSYLVEGSRPRLAASGHLVYATTDGLWAAPFDPRELEITGPAFRVAADFIETRAGFSDFDISPNGTLIYFTGDDRGRSLVAVDRQGREQVLTPEHRAYDGPRYSPDGNRVALRIWEGGPHIFVYEIGRGTFTRLTFDPPNYYPEWSPDGRRVAFVTEGDGGMDLYWRAADGSGSPEPLVTADGPQWEAAFAQDGSRLVYRQNDPETGRDLWVVSLDGNAEPEPLLKTPDQERAPRVSPDGQFVAYVSDETRRAEVFVRTFEESGGKWQISGDGGTEPLWSRDGKELFYRRGDELIAVAVETQPAFSIGASQVLFEGPYVPNPMHTNYDIHPDGDRFVMVKSAEGERQVVVVLNWVSELEGRGSN